MEPELDASTLASLLAKAHLVVTWTGQDTIRRDAAGAPHLTAARQDYLRARLDAYAAIRPLTISDTQGCTCDPHRPDPGTCMYHYGASLQPGNHRIPCNCPAYYDGCGCPPARDGWPRDLAAGDDGRPSDQ